MEAFLAPLKELAGYEELERAAAVPGAHSLTGCIDAQKPHIVYGLGRAAHARLIVLPGERRAREFLDAYRFFEPDALFYPERDVLFYQADVRGRALTGERMKVYRALFEEERFTVVTTFDALLDPLMRPEQIASALLQFAVGERIDLEKTRRRLVQMGYVCETQVTRPGEFGVRGGILDVFPLTEEEPYRIELWDDEIDSIRTFSCESQRSLEAVDAVTVYPASEIVLGEGQICTGLARIAQDAKKAEGVFRSQMKTQEAFRVREAAERIRTALLELEDIRQAESWLPYFCPYRVNFLDYILWALEMKDSAAAAGRRPDEEARRLAQPAAREAAAGRSGNRSAAAKEAGAGFSSLLVFLDEPARCLEAGGALEEEFRMSMQNRLEQGYILSGQADMLFGREEAAAALKQQRLVLVSSFETHLPLLPAKDSFSVRVQSVHSYRGSFELLVKDLLHYRKGKYRVLLLCASRTRAARLAQDLLDEGLTAFYTENSDRAAAPGETMLLDGSLSQGFAYPDIRFVVLTESDIFGAGKKEKKRAKRSSPGLLPEDLKPGDYVIHENHGLGIFRGMERIEVDHTLRDYVRIEYDKGGVLYVAATQMDLLRRYAGASGAEGKLPKLNRLGGQEWTKTRSRVRRSVREVATQLVELYALRQNSKGFACGPDTLWQQEFEELFPYEETEDQLRAIRETKADMESTKIMDRLICGDVGFGKTEVAIRAAFKAVQESKQVAYLVPTTILAQQHYNTFVQRLKDFPVNVELLCRFRTAKEQKETISRLKKGLTDIVIGTHRLLSADVQFKDLGLLIIDEEQRFGVAHKEKIKQMKHTVDVLTLTATPIPRTLHMSMIGVRDISVLEEPPQDRMPIQTYVMEYNEEMVREAITRELARGGQVYYVYNRVRTIAEAAARIGALVPEAEVAFAHGQMSERELENVMYRFINGEVDVLVSTTIIETGLDISNVNTMIVCDADNLGLAQLYQLRGRIGRSNRTAYAFLMYRRDKVLREVAEKRLSAIREFSDLGSGIHIAMKDLEIRGAGTLLGEEQHGHMEAVGYDLYCRMLKEAVGELQGEAPVQEFETSIDLALDAYIPDCYVPDEAQRLELYRRIAEVGDEAGRTEMLDELIDRFGEPPRAVANLLTAAELRHAAHRTYLTEIRETPEIIRFTLYEKAPIDAARIPELVRAMRPALSFSAKGKNPCFVYRKQTHTDTLAVIREFIGCLGELIT